MEPQPPKDRDDGRPKKFSSADRKKLDTFLSALCDSKGLPSVPKADGEASPRRTECRCPCKDAEWRAQLDVPGGIVCVYSKITRRDAEGPHRDITLAVTYENEQGESDYADITFCDSEIRWIMEALWHAPIWE
jgi:hypothetical protein